MDKISTSNKADAAFIKLNSGIEMVNNVSGLAAEVRSSRQGDVVYMRGKTSGTVRGTIWQTSTSVPNVGGSTYYDLVTANYTGQQGDSGGLVYGTYSTSTTGTKYILGVHMGMDGQFKYETADDLVSIWEMSYYPDYCCGVWRDNEGSVIIYIQDTEEGEKGKQEILDFMWTDNL